MCPVPPPLLVLAQDDLRKAKQLQDDQLQRERMQKTLERTTRDANIRVRTMEMLLQCVQGRADIAICWSICDLFSTCSVYSTGGSVFAFGAQLFHADKYICWSSETDWQLG